MPNSIGNYSYLSDESPKDQPWDSHRKSTESVQKSYSQIGYRRYADRMAECSCKLEFSQITDALTGERHFKLKSANFCRVRFCPVCQWRRSLKWRAKFFAALPALASAFPDHRWIFLTLTVRNCPLTDLRDTLADMNKGFVRLTQLVRFPATGWIKSVEVTKEEKTKGTTGFAHPHFHCLLFVPSKYFSGRNYLKQEEWQSLWKQSARLDYDPIVNVKAVRPKGDRLKRSQQAIHADISELSRSDKANNSSEQMKAICETLKYSVKESDLESDPEWLGELTRQLYKTRAVSVGGSLRSFLAEEKDDDDLINVDDNQEIESVNVDAITWFFGWHKDISRYVKTENPQQVLLRVESDKN